MRNKKKIWVVSPLMYLMAAAMLVMAGLTWRYNAALSIVELTAAGLVIVAVAASDILYRRSLRNTARGARRVFSGEERRALESFALPLAIVAEAGDIVWANEAFSQSLCDGGPCVGDNILHYLYPRSFRQILAEKGAAVTHRGKEYTVYSARAKEGYLLYFVDETYYRGVAREYRDKKTVVCLAVFDNREELSRDSVGGDDSRVAADVEAVLRRWTVEDLGGFVRRLSNGRYLILTDDAHIENAKQRRFHVLDEVREVKNAGGMSATVSIGVGRGADSAAEGERWARQALDMALGRGGDQVVLKQPGDDYDFFGGLSRGVEKRDTVRTRVIASTLSDHVKASDRVFIMGHKNSDLDAVGAAAGMWAVIRKGLEAPAHVVVNRASTLAGSMIDRLQKAYPGEDMFISPQEALQTATERSLLIVVDTHSVNLVESAELLDAVPRVVVIDHHRMVVSHIRNAVIFYHEPYASSASEMVTELVQYIKSGAIDQVDADALMAGIALDTKNFVMNTGVRTFEASAFLRRRGADMVAVRKAFSNTLDDYRRKSRLVSGAELYKGCAIATSDREGDDLRVAAAQAADELLSIQGVKASFVLYRMGSSDVGISARSLGELNVQVVLEELGGGGHFAGAGAQLHNVSIRDARLLLIQALDAKLSESGGD